MANLYIYNFQAVNQLDFIIRKAKSATTNLFFIPLDAIHKYNNTGTPSHNHATRPGPCGSG